MKSRRYTLILGLDTAGTPAIRAMYDDWSDQYQMTDVKDDPAYKGVRNKLFARLKGRLAALGDWPFHETSYYNAKFGIVTDADRRFVGFQSP
jgi:hypothetical protein